MPTKTLLTVLFLATYSLCYSATCESVVSGLWNDPTTWDCGSVPTDGDVALISAGNIVEVSCNCGTYSNFRIEVYGTLDFQNGKKITMDANSEVQLYAGGLVTGGNGGSKIVIGGDGKWAGPDVVNGPAFSDNSTVGFQAGILPIELLSFDAEVSEEKTIRIHWTTAQEINNDFFTIERSSTGTNFREISEVPSAGNSSKEINYETYDNEPLEGVAYYRLKQTDYDGHYEYFRIVDVKLENNNKIGDCNGTLRVFPNPCKEECKVTLYQCEDNIVNDVRIDVLDVFGRIMLSETPRKEANGSFTYSINTSNNYPSGIYFVKGIGSNARSQKIIVK
jgi:hypothetical protein